MEVTPIGARVKVDHGTGVVVKYEAVGASGIRQTLVAPEHGCYRLMIELDPDHTWQRERPDLLYCDWEKNVEVLDGNA